MERRRGIRHPIHVPVVCGEGHGITTDVSTRGVRFATSGGFPEGEQIRFAITLPDSDDPTFRVHCAGTVVRVDWSDSTAYVAATIDDINFSS